MRLHDLRHSYASPAIANGESALSVGELLGYRGLRVNGRYLHGDVGSPHLVFHRTAELFT